MMGSSSCLPAREAYPRSSSLLRFLSSRDECTGNGGPGLFEYSSIVGRLDLGLRGLEGDALARDRDNQPFLGLGRQQVRTETACRTVDCLAWRDGCGCDFFVDGSRSQRRRQEKPSRTSKNFVAGARTCSCTASKRISSQGLLAECRH
jgi:hypothetical protein